MQVPKSFCGINELESTYTDRTPTIVSGQIKCSGIVNGKQ